MPQIIPPAPRRMTQKQKILALMCRQPNKWFYPYEFMKPNLGALYIGYKAPTRITELHKSYPTLFNKKTEDKYMQRQLNIAAIDTWYPTLPEGLKEIIDLYYYEENK